MKICRPVGLKVIFLACIALLLLGTAASAENRAGAVTLSPFVGKFWFDHHLDYDNDLIYGIGLGYNLTDALSAELSYGRVDTERGVTGAKVDGTLDLYRLEGLYHLNMIDPNKRIVPYIALGAGMFSLDSLPNRSGRDNDLALDYGIGIKYFLNSDVALRVDGRNVYNLRGEGDDSDSTYSSSWLLTFGLTFQLGAQKEAPAPVVAAAPAPAPPAPVVVAPADSDKDGVTDDLDKCPDTPAGVQVDKDGCPVDSDGDGVPDYLDKCPGTPKGTKVDKLGCPVAEKATITEQGTYNFGIVYFDTMKATIKPESRPVLNNVAKYLRDNKEVKLEVQGHTDSTGPDDLNMKLSDARANAVKDYLTDKGIAEDRLATKGFGETKPAATNKTKDGRAKNRRIEFLPIQ